ncbi:glycosyltransferase involved in cell wall biosynthesis [Thiogranum longum]|uniref:Glycosyltransferase involved in cell wall biosynthesis n=1 Tax=Thiogranum longum TaxID=1537524 RepID=A0A4R1HLV8_9GAMM|nr:glycosyltransferase [Thiogranum longum]TCK18192.1 glycosyltransferase involved in cell wall biosynthesis [Thiogranum longum]
MSDKTEISAVIPVTDRYDDIRELYEDYKQGLSELGRSFEFIFVLDGEYPELLEQLKELQQQGDRLKIVKLSKSFGEATALSAGFDHAVGDIILTLPAYYQVEPSEIPRLITELEHCDMVISYRWPRAGSRFEMIRRKLFHKILKSFTGASYNDLGCGVRAFKRQIAQEVTIYGDQHRFLPVLASRVGFKVHEVQVSQSSRDQFHGHYRVREYLHRLLDIFTIFFLVRFTKKPLRFFGMVGTITLSIGAAFLAYLLFDRLFMGVPLAERPALLLSSLLVVLGVQILALGLIGELIIFTHARDMKEYTVEEIVG